MPALIHSADGECTERRAKMAMTCDAYADFYARYVVECARAGVGPLPPNDFAELLATIAAASENRYG
jgi:hypothetical protein